MTVRERNLWLIVGTVIILGGIVSWLSGRFSMTAAAPGDPERHISWQEARRVLQRDANIRYRAESVQNHLRELQKQFVSPADGTDAQVNLLQDVETMAAATRLNVQNKNSLRYSDQEIGVSLEGKTSATALIAFMQKVATAPVALKIRRLQIHALKDKTAVSYIIVVSTTLLGKKG